MRSKTQPVQTVALGTIRIGDGGRWRRVRELIATASALQFVVVVHGERTSDGTAGLSPNQRVGTDEPATFTAPTTELDLDPAAARLARAIVGIAQHPDDPRSLAHWGRAVGAARGTLRAWCQAAGSQPRPALYFARAFRACWLGCLHGIPARELLDFSDPRTLHKFVMRGLGIDNPPHEPVAAALAFCEGQRYLQQPRIVRAVIREICRTNGNESRGDVSVIVGAEEANPRDRARR